MQTHILTNDEALRLVDGARAASSTALPPRAYLWQLEGSELGDAAILFFGGDLAIAVTSDEGGGGAR